VVVLCAHLLLAFERLCLSFWLVSSNKNGPSTSANRALKAWHERGTIFVRFASGHEVSFPMKGNPRLESAAEEEVGRIEISPFGLHWPTLDEDLSFAGILEGRYGQR
jgi:hypothetical protein